MYAERQSLTLRNCLAEACVGVVAYYSAARAASQFGVELIFLGAVVEEAEVVGAEVDASLLDEGFASDAHGEGVTYGDVFRRR